jgi:putative endonuclease
MTSLSRRRAEAWGRRAERRAALFLTLKGYRILSRRHRTPWGEIDLVIRRGGTLAFVEIKARRGEAEGLEAITPTARRRIARAAEAFLAGFPARPEAIRFDVVVVMPRRLPRHLPGAWRSGD